MKFHLLLIPLFATSALVLAGCATNNLVSQTSTINANVTVVSENVNTVVNTNAAINTNTVANEDVNTSVVVSTNTSAHPDWKTYTDNAIGIKMQFPKDWHINVFGLPGYFWISSVSLEDRTDPEKMNTDEVKYSASVRVSLRTLDNTQSINDWYNQYFLSHPLQNVTEVKNTTIAGLQAVEVKRSEVFEGKTYFFVDYFVTQAGHVIDVEFDYTDTQHTETYQQILDSIMVFENPIIDGSYVIARENIFPKAIATVDISADFYSPEYNHFKKADGSSGFGETLLIGPDKAVHHIAADIAQYMGRGVSDPNNADRIFMSTTSMPPGFIYTDKQDDCTIALHSFNLVTGEVVEFYSERNIGNSPSGDGNCRVLRVQGIQGSKLILMVDDIDNSPGPCWSAWLDYSERIMYLELSDIQPGLKKFIIPEAKIVAEELERLECQKEIQ